MRLKYSIPAVTLAFWGGELYTVKNYGIGTFILSLIFLLGSYTIIDYGADDRANRKIQEMRGGEAVNKHREK